MTCLARVAVRARHSELGPVDLVLYNKGRSAADLPAEGGAVEEVRSPNVGREGEAYLRHILAHYERLPEVLVFSQARTVRPPVRRARGARSCPRLARQRAAPAPSPLSRPQARVTDHLVAWLAFGDPRRWRSSLTHLPGPLPWTILGHL